MDFVHDDIRTLYFRFLVPSLAGAVVLSIYCFVDAIAVGQAEGALGTAAMAVINPVYGIMTFLAILCGTGGSALMGVARGQGNEEKGNACFTDAVFLMILLALLAWGILWRFRDPIFTLFGADAQVLPKTVEYGKWIVRFMPTFICPIFLAAFVRNDGAPKLAMAAVITGGCVNMFGDWFLVFPMGMGMAGAALASVAGTSVQFVILLLHFFRPSCRLRLVRPHHILRGFRRILALGLGAGILDLGSVALGVLLNRQIMRYGGTVDLAVYGVMATIMVLFQALFGGVGQAVQPLVSASFGACRPERIRTLWRLSSLTVLGLGVLFTLSGELFPLPITKLFMKATPEVLAAAPEIFRLFFLDFLFLGFPVLGAYYLQSVMEDRLSLLFGLMHSVALSGLLLLLLPRILGMPGVWLAVPLADLITAAAALLSILCLVNRRLDQTLSGGAP